MAKPTPSLSDRIAARMAEKKPAQGGQNRAAFLALRDEIRAAMEDGWSVKVIWETLRDEGKISFSYPAFCGYANRLILSPHQAKAVKVETTAVTESNQATKQTPKQVEKKKPQATGFTFNSDPNKEDLF
jgi:hypothetical protein